MDDLTQHIGKEFGPSDWLLVEQDRIDKFADATGDHQFIHVDAEMAKLTPFGVTIAHGFLTLSLVASLAAGLLPKIDGVKMGLNYGLDKVRFLTPVKVNQRVRARSKLLAVEEKRPGQLLLKSEVTIEIEGEKRPAMIAETLALLFVS